jgi:hypothetical protein
MQATFRPTPKFVIAILVSAHCGAASESFSKNVVVTAVESQLCAAERAECGFTSHDVTPTFITQTLTPIDCFA